MSCLCSILSKLHSRGSLSSRGSSSRGSSSRSSREGAKEGNPGDGGVAVVGSSHVLDGRGSNHGLGQQLGGGGNTDGGDGVGVHLGHRVGHRGDRWHALHLHRLGSLHSNWGSSVDVVVGNGGNSGVHGSNWVGDNMGHSVGNWSSHHSLADGVDEAVLVEVLREALQGKRAKALGGLDGVSEGRSEGSSREARVDVGGGSREADGEERGQDLEYSVIFWIIL